MRNRPHTVGSYVHVMKRGARGFPIVREDADRKRFLLLLRHFNDTNATDNWYRDLLDSDLVHTFDRPHDWPEQRKLVHILCYCLLENHFHLLLKEVRKGGIAKFMQKLGIGMTMHYNEKYRERGSIFQGSYRSRTVEDDRYLQYVSSYIQVKNPFELFGGGEFHTLRGFGRAYEWATRHGYSSLGEYVGVRTTKILDKGLLGELFDPKEFRDFSRDVIEGRVSNIDAPRSFHLE